MTAPALHAFVVTLCFAGADQSGPVHTAIVLAPAEAAAAAMVTHAFMREHPTELPLTCCIATEIEPGFLRHLLRAVEGRLPESGNAEVLSLVPNEPDPHQPVGGSILLDAADASTFTGLASDRLWKRQPHVGAVWEPPPPPEDVA